MAVLLATTLLSWARHQKLTDTRDKESVWNMVSAYVGIMGRQVDGVGVGTIVDNDLRRDSPTSVLLMGH